MRSRKAVIVSIVGTLIAVAVALPLAFAGKSDATTTAATRTLYASTVEWKGSASVAKEPYPGPAGAPYESCAPGSTGCDLNGDKTKWAIETYRFDTATLVAYAGERVVLKVFGVNGSKQDVIVPALKKKFTVKRGVVTTVDFGVIKRPGIYTITSITHAPVQTMDLVVLPKP